MVKRCPRGLERHNGGLEPSHHDPHDTSGIALGSCHQRCRLRYGPLPRRAERTPAASLGKYRITAHGRVWLTSHASSEESAS